MISESGTNNPNSVAISSWRPVWLNWPLFLGATLLGAVFLTYLPVLHAGFIWDDNNQVTDNPCIVGPLGLKEIWTTSAARFFPMTLTTYWVEHAFWKIRPGPYHLVNGLEHAASAVLLWRILTLQKVQGAWLGTAIWALHPVEVESVAWVSELKNTQSGLFYLLTIFFFIKGQTAKPTEGKTGIGLDYALTIFFSFLAMTSKSSTVILPLVLMLCAWWMDRRWNWPGQIKVWPIFIMSVLVSVMTVKAVGMEEPIAAYAPQTLPERLATAGCAIWFYLGKLLWPHPLMTVYPRWEIHAGNAFIFIPLLLALATLLLFWWKRDDWSRPYFFVFAYFVIALLPVLGLVNHNFLQHSFVADHFQYLASMGPLVLVGSGLARLADFFIPKSIGIQSSLCAILLLILGVSSWQRASVYENSETLWTDELTKNPGCWMGQNNAGIALFEKGRIEEAIFHYQKSLEIYPGFGEAEANLANALFQAGRRDEAMAHYQKALEINPNDAETHNNFGSALARSSQVNQAIPQFEKAVELSPAYAEAHDNLGTAYFQTGQIDKAATQFYFALGLNQEDARARNGLVKLQAAKRQPANHSSG